MENIENILSSDITFIIVDLLFGSAMAFVSIVAYGKTKRMFSLFFVISSLFLYLEMVFRILERVNVFILKSITLNGIPVVQYALYDMPYIFIVIGFILMMNEKK
jgi:hypothetical protein